MTSRHPCSLIGCCQTGSGLQRDRLVQVYRDSDGFRSTESQMGSGLQRVRRVQVSREPMKTMMKTMMGVLVLSSVFCVSADSLYEETAYACCSETDEEGVDVLEGEVKWYADFKNNTIIEPQPSFIDHIIHPAGGFELAETELQLCRIFLKIDRKALKDLPLERDPPSRPIIYARDTLDLGEKNTLICHVTGFYPAPVAFYWTKNEEKVTEGTSISVPYINKDRTFNQFSRLDFTPQLGDVYSCTVSHLALKQPLTRIWNVEKPQPSIGPEVFCGLGLTVGLLGVAAGTFFLIKGNECS